MVKVCLPALTSGRQRLGDKDPSTPPKFNKPNCSHISYLGLWLFYFLLFLPFFPFHCFNSNFFCGFISSWSAATGMRQHSSSDPSSAGAQGLLCMPYIRQFCLQTQGFWFYQQYNVVGLCSVWLTVTSALFLCSCLSGTKLKVIDKTRIFLNLQSIPDFRDEIPLPEKNVAVSGSLGELLPYLKGRALLSTCGSSEPAPGLLCWAFLCIFSPFFAFSVWSVSSLCWVNVESVLLCFAVCKWLLWKSL